MKIFPLKLSDAVYEDLKKVSEYENTPMSHIVRGYFVEPVQKKVQIIQETQYQNAQPVSLLESARQFTYDGPVAQNDKTDDELLYGEDMG